jgi:CP family cyanate transporter-like MFS transporter
LRSWLQLALLWVVGIDLRLTLLAVPPLLPRIHHDLALDEIAVGALTATPVLLFGVAAIAGSLLIARLGARRATIAGLLLVAIAGAVRGIGPNAATLFGMTFVMGLGIAVCQPAAPTLIGEWLPRRIGFATSVYVNGILVGESIGAALTIPLLPYVGGRWELALAVWSIPVLLTALVFWLFVPHVPEPHDAEPRAWWPDWREFLTWRLGAVQAGISVLYFGLNAYIPDYFHAVGRPWMSPIAIAALNVSQLPGSFATLAVAHKLAGRREFFVAVLAAAIPGLAFMLVGPDWLAVAGVVVFGFCSAIGLSMVVALPPMLTHQEDVHRLSAGMFTIGYVGSFLGTLAGGAIWDATGIPGTAFVPVAVGAAMVALAGGTLRGAVAAKAG